MENVIELTSKQIYMKDYHQRYRALHKNDENFKAIKKKAANRFYHTHKERNKERILFYSAKSRAKNKGLLFTIDIKDIVIPEYCPILGVKLNREANTNWTDNSPSLDRIDNSLGYTPDNIQIISALANTMKNKATPEQLLKFAAWTNATFKE